MTANLSVSASQVLNTRDLNLRPEREVTEIVGTFLSVAEAVVAHWVEYSKGLLLFVMVPGDARSAQRLLDRLDHRRRPDDVVDRCGKVVDDTFHQICVDKARLPVPFAD